MANISGHYYAFQVPGNPGVWITDLQCFCERTSAGCPPAAQAPVTHPEGYGLLGHWLWTGEPEAKPQPRASPQSTLFLTQLLTTEKLISNAQIDTEQLSISPRSLDSDGAFGGAKAVCTLTSAPAHTATLANNTVNTINSDAFSSGAEIIFIPTTSLMQCNKKAPGHDDILLRSLSTENRLLSMLK